MRNADESRKSKHDSACAMTVATNVSSAGRASDAHRDRQVFHQKVVRNPRHNPVFTSDFCLPHASPEPLIQRTKVASSERRFDERRSRRTCDMVTLAAVLLG